MVDTPVKQNTNGRAVVFEKGITCKSDLSLVVVRLKPSASS